MNKEHLKSLFTYHSEKKSSVFLVNYFKVLLFNLLAKHAFKESLKILQASCPLKADFFHSVYDDRFGKDYLSSIYLKIQLPGMPKRKLIGSGEDGNIHKSLVIAIAETVERLGHYVSNQLFSDFTRPPSSSGCAFHPVKQIAKYNAISELMERDLFLVNWYGNPVLEWYDPSQFCQLSEVNKYISDNGGVLRLHYYFSDEFKFHSVTLTAHFPDKVGDNQFSFFCGLGGGISLNEAINKSKKEIIRFVRLYLNKEVSIKKLLTSVRKASSAGRLYLYQDALYQKNYLDRVQMVNDLILDTKADRVDKARWVEMILKAYPEFQLIKLPLMPKFELLGYLYRATNSELQVLDFYDTPDINEKRLKRYFNNKFSVQNNLHFIP